MNKKIKNYPCACCSFLTMSNLEPSSFDICPVCYWEYDDVQFHDIDFDGGANEESLKEARKNFLKFGVSSLKFLPFVKTPII